MVKGMGKRASGVCFILDVGALLDAQTKASLSEPSPLRV
jgi:hypothetical protein